MITIRPIEGKDFDQVVSLWNETHPADPVTERFFKRKVLLDVSFEPEGFLLAQEEGTLFGFLYLVRRLRPLDNDNSPLPDTCWVSAYGVLPDAPEGTDQLLLKAADELAGKWGKNKISATTYSPFYFTQGFDLEEEQKNIEAFLQAGYKKGNVSYARDLNLFRYRVPEELKEARKKAEAEGFSFGALKKEDIIPLWNHLNHYQHQGWRIRIRELMYDNDDLGRIRVVRCKDEIIGFCIFGDPDGSPERFGPFGVREDFRGKKLGQILLADCLTEMKKRGLHNAWMQWTESKNAAEKVYTKAGFELTRSHVVMEKNLQG